MAVLLCATHTICRSKFISEFGSQSYPTLATYAEATAPEDWQVDNQMTGFRNRRCANRNIGPLGGRQQYGSSCDPYL